ncbi:GEVED domain-containing protein [Blastopirellula sp. JC732]|uniref:GEVED domain-containing protein n=1 Tax=Blastopirellula sediminis TaxID=2894196 RepID=A0A9X1MLN5_9BACT|nr:GEVED domain-containing protein [Blastopirellula sediminis]MCC9608309.1 GEVED domain-containing protein [Blastopirellula sediminis]MCC9628914.1 GEVED domain-containing protein [Blastopirellula sediminis]
MALTTAPLGDQFVVAETLGFTATPAAVAVQADGSIITAWESYEEDGSGFGVFAQRFDANGNEIDATPFLVNTTTDREQSAPAIATDAAGNVLIVWQSKGQDEADTFGVYGQWYDSLGAKLGGEFRINSTTAGDQKAPDVAIDGSGDAIVTWQSFGQDGSDWGVYYTRLDAVAGGVADTTPAGDMLVNDAVAGPQQNPTVAAATNGNFVIAWEAIDPIGGDDASLDIYAKVFDSTGTEITLGEQLANTDQLRDQVTPDAAIDADGDFVVVWTAGGIPGSGSDVFGQRFDEMGVRAGQQFRVNDTTLAEQVGGVVAMDQDGNFFVTWQSVHQDGFSEGVYGRAYAAAGTELTGETLINTTIEGPQSLPSIGMNANGRAAVIWHSKNEEHDSALFAQRFDLSGASLTKVGGELELASLVELEGSKSAAAIDQQGRTVVAFESYDEDGDAMGVYAQLLDEFGDPIGDRFLVNTDFTTGDQSAPAVARALDGRFVIVWQSKNQDGDGNGIFAQRYSATGVPIDNAIQVNTTSAGNQTKPAVAMAEDGRFVVAWQGDDGLEDGGVDGTTDIFAQRFDADGNAVGSEFQVNQFEATDQTTPAITMNASGEFAIAWVSSHPSLDVVGAEEAIDAEKSVFVQWYDANGVSTGPEVIAHVYVKDAQESPQIGMDAAGNFVAAWQSINQDGDTWGVFGRQFNRQKVPLTAAEFQINEQTEGLQRLVGLGVDAAGNFVVAYESTAAGTDDGISTDIYRREYFADGSPNGGENVVNTWTGGPQTLPVVARTATGNYGVFWSGQGFSHIDGVHGRLYDVNLIDDPGQPSRVPIGDQFLVSPTLGFEFSSPAIAVNDNGSLTIAFETFEEDGSGFGIFTERLDASGNAIVGSRQQVNTTTLDDQSAPAIATDGNGNVLIVWQSKDANGLGVFGQWLDGAGQKIGAEFQLNSQVIGDQFHPDLAIDDQGRALVAWQSAGQDGDGLGVFYVTLDSIGDTTPSAEQQANVAVVGDQFSPRVAAAAHDASAANNQFVIAWQGPAPIVPGEEEVEASVDVYARRIDSLGMPVGGEIVVNSIAEKDQILPDLGMDAAGNVVFVWQSEGQTGSGSDVYARRMTADGTLLEFDQLVNTTTTRPQRLPSVAVDAAGNYLVTWQSQHQDGYSWGIYRQAFDSSGAEVGEEVIVNHRVEGPQTAPTAASNANGDGIVAWLGNSATHEPSIFGHLFDLPATEVAGEFLLTSYVGLEANAPAAAMNAQRESIVVWESYAEAEDDGSGLGIFGQLLDSQGAPIGDRFLINENIKLGNQSSPAVARAPSGQFVVAWESEVADGTYDIFARRFFANGTTNGDIFQVNPVAISGDQKAPAVAIGADGRFVIAWQTDSGDGSTDIMAQRYLPNGDADGSAFQVNNETALDQYDPAISMNASGQFVIVWVSDHPAADPETMDVDSEKSVFAQWYGSDGQAMGDEVLVHNYVKDAQEAPAVGIDALGRFVVAWQSINQDGNSWGVFARRFNADKTAIDNREFVVNETRMGPQRFAGIGVDQYGRFVIAWQSNERAELTDTGSGGGGGGGEAETPEGSSWDLYSRQYSWDGSPEGGELPVNVWQMGPQILPVVAQAPGGDFGVFWLGQGPDHVEGVHGRLYQSLFEFGDAPDANYKTLLASNGARHLPFSQLYLGAGMDGEFDGQPSSDAKGDDNDANGDDEDGVVMPRVLLSGTSANFTVTASAAGKLDAWIDFNHNGVFEPSEKIANSIDVSAGANLISVAVPQFSPTSLTFARFRISSTGGLAPTGVALDGEVEDYAIQIIASPVTLTNDGTLYVVGAQTGDAVIVSKYFNRIDVFTNIGASRWWPTRTYNFNAISVNQLVILTLGGNDYVQVRDWWGLALPTYIDGGDGIDELRGGAGPDVILGGRGNDRIYGGNGNDILSGGDGDDLLVGNGGSNLLIGGAGRDELYAQDASLLGSLIPQPTKGSILIGGQSTLETQLQTDPQAVAAQFQVRWVDRLAAGDNYDDIVDDIVANWLIPGRDVFNDKSEDLLHGGYFSRDLFFADLDQLGHRADRTSGDGNDTVIEINYEDAWP